jgi:AraC family transcriptional regulator, positive regulator of tynA and feaB
MQGHIVSGYRQFNCPNEWLDAISPHFVGARSAKRQGRFSLTAHLEALAGGALFDIDVSRSGLQPGQYGLSIDGVATHPYFALWQGRGACSIEQAQRVIHLPAGCWALFDAGSAYSFSAFDGSRSVVVMIPQRADNRWADLIAPGGFVLSRSNDSDIAATLVMEWLGRSAGLDERIRRSFENLLIDLLDSALERCVPSRSLDIPIVKRRAKLRRAEDIIAAEISNAALRPDDIGRAIGVSRRALYRLFRQIGHTPMSYVRQQRLREAARRLRDAKTRDLTITRIAYDLGFADPAHFSRCFRGQYGMSPRQWGTGAESD